MGEVGESPTLEKFGGNFGRKGERRKREGRWKRGEKGKERQGQKGKWRREIVKGEEKILYSCSLCVRLSRHWKYQRIVWSSGVDLSKVWEKRILGFCRHRCRDLAPNKGGFEGESNWDHLRKHCHTWRKNHGIRCEH